MRETLDGALFTVWLNVNETEPMKFVSPLYVAVMLRGCADARSTDVVHVAAPELIGCAAQPLKIAPLSLNASTPVGVPAPGADTARLAVNVTDWPTRLGSLSDVNTTNVAARFTNCVNASEVEVRKAASPE